MNDPRTADLVADFARRSTIARLHTFAGVLTPYDLDVLHKRVAQQFECSPDEVRTILQAQETTNG